MPDSLSLWMDDFFRSYFQFRPVNATFVGVHKFDAKLPDYSEEGLEDFQGSMEGLIERRERGLKTSNRIEEIDLELATNFLLIQLEELKGLHFQRGNPAIYSSEAIFGLISLCLREFGPRSEAISSMVARMKAIPALLEQGKSNVASAPRDWTSEAIRQCDGAIKFLESGVKILANDWQISNFHFLENATVALTAFKSYREYLSVELLSHAREEYGCGSSFYNLLLEKGHAVDEMDIERLAEYGRKRVGEQKDLLWKVTLKLRRDGNWEAILSDLSKLHPTVDTILMSCQECWAECRRVAIEKDLVEWPDYPLIYKFIDPHFVEAAPYLYFLYYRSPAPYDNAKTNYYLITPVDKNLPPEELEQKLRAISYSTIKHNHVVHHGAIGHHLQNYNAYHGVSSIGKIAGVDCASRIAMFCGGTMAEGWATYSTHLMDEAGFNSPEEHVAELHSSMRLAARSVVDANLHSGKFSFKDAVAYYVADIGMTPKAAHSEVVKNSMFPCTGGMYLLGFDGILNLRNAVTKREGLGFSLKRFHRSLLNYGSIPVSMVTRELLGS
jgi:hypothetical protein